MASTAEKRATPDVLAPPPLHPRFPLADGARGVAVPAVMIVHAWLFTGGFGGFTESLPNRAVVRLDTAVAVFFFLSAFLLYRPMIAHRAGGPAAPKVGDYARRRFLRIYPAYWLALTALAIFPGLVGVFSDQWWSFYSLFFFLDPANSSQPCIGDPGFRCGLPQSWTLTVEMTFYIVLPLYAMLTARLFRDRDVGSWVRWEVGMLVVLMAISLVLGALPEMRDHAWFRFSFLSHFFWLGLGLAAAVISAGYRNQRGALPSPLRYLAERQGLCWGLAFAIYLFTVFVFYPAPFPVAPFSEAERMGLDFLQGLLAVLLLIPAAFGDPNRGVAARVFGHPAVVWTGLISYGLYLWSVTITVDLGVGGAEAGFWPVLILSTLITLPFAIASYYLLERPLMRFKYRPLRELIRRQR
ncbi:MAG TPA: acyltransferase [Solirubrobacterales bacterium]